eukprot:gene9600-11370_t
MGVVSGGCETDIIGSASYQWDASAYSSAGSGSTTLSNAGTVGSGYDLTGTTASGSSINGLYTVGIPTTSSYGLSVSLSGNTIANAHIFMVYSPRSTLSGASRVIFRDQANGYNFGPYGTSSDEIRSTTSSGGTNGAANGGTISGTPYIVEAYLPPSGSATAHLSISNGVGTGPLYFSAFSRESDPQNVLTTINVAGTMYDSNHASDIDLGELLIFNGDVSGYNPFTNRLDIYNYLSNKWNIGNRGEIATLLIKILQTLQQRMPGHVGCSLI